MYLKMLLYNVWVVTCFNIEGLELRSTYLRHLVTTLWTFSKATKPLKLVYGHVWAYFSQANPCGIHVNGNRWYSAHECPYVSAFAIVITTCTKCKLGFILFREFLIGQFFDYIFDWLDLFYTNSLSFSFESACINRAIIEVLNENTK